MTETFLGNYRLLEQLGQGGMGTVYRAEHRRIPRRVAVKVLSRELSANASVVDRFFTEARAAATIQHPSIVEIFDCDLQDEQAYIVMALLEGESLAQRIRRSVATREPVPLPEIARIAQEIARGMSAAHAQGIVHRDLKPDNVFLHRPANEATAHVKILDFGIAKLATESGARHTTTGAVIGTPPYMSPEQCRGAGRVDWRADIYALGCILFAMACGRPPFLREGSGELIVAHLLEEPPALESLRPGLPSDFQALVSRLLAKAPEDRPQSMDEVLAALETLKTAEDAAPASPKHEPSATLALPAEDRDAPTVVLAMPDDAPPTEAIAEARAITPTRTEETIVRHAGEVSPAEGVPIVPDGRAEPRRGTRRALVRTAGALGVVATLGGIWAFSAAWRRRTTSETTETKTITSPVKTEVAPPTPTAATATPSREDRPAASAPIVTSPPAGEPSDATSPGDAPGPTSAADTRHTTRSARPVAKAPARHAEKTPGAKPAPRDVLLPITKLRPLTAPGPSSTTPRPAP